MFKLRVATHEESTLKKVAVGSSLGDKPTPKKKVSRLLVSKLLIDVYVDGPICILTFKRFMHL